VHSNAQGQLYADHKKISKEQEADLLNRIVPDFGKHKTRRQSIQQYMDADHNKEFVSTYKTKFNNDNVKMKPKVFEKFYHDNLMEKAYTDPIIKTKKNNNFISRVKEAEEEYYTKTKFGQD